MGLEEQTTDDLARLMDNATRNGLDPLGMRYIELDNINGFVIGGYALDFDQVPAGYEPPRGWHCYAVDEHETGSPHPYLAGREETVLKVRPIARDLEGRLSGCRGEEHRMDLLTMEDLDAVAGLDEYGLDVFGEDDWGFTDERTLYGDMADGTVERLDWAVSDANETKGATR